MIDRRDFLSGLLALAYGPVMDGNSGNPGDHGHKQYIADLAGCDMNALGVPRDPSVLDQACHPVGPERVVVVDHSELRRLRPRHRTLKRLLLREEEIQRMKRPDDLAQPTAKLDLVVGLMDRLTCHYLLPDLLSCWARTFWRREMLGTTGFGHGLGLHHDFQLLEPVRTDNEIADWWLVLLPDGVDWLALDEHPVYFMVGPVMEERRLTGSYMRVMAAIWRGLHHVVKAEGVNLAGWARRLAGLPAVEAAREFNVAMVRGLSCKSPRQ